VVVVVVARFVVAGFVVVVVAIVAGFVTGFVVVVVVAIVAGFVTGFVVVVVRGATEVDVVSGRIVVEVACWLAVVVSRLLSR